MSGLLARWKQQARRLKREVHTLYLAYRDPRTPWYARLFAAVVVGYAFSPIILIWLAAAGLTIWWLVRVFDLP